MARAANWGNCKDSLIQRSSDGGRKQGALKKKKPKREVGSGRLSLVGPTRRKACPRGKTPPKQEREKQEKMTGVIQRGTCVTGKTTRSKKERHPTQKINRPNKTERRARCQERGPKTQKKPPTKKRGTTIEKKGGEEDIDINTETKNKPSRNQIYEQKKENTQTYEGLSGRHNSISSGKGRKKTYAQTGSSK